MYSKMITFINNIKLSNYVWVFQYHLFLHNFCFKVDLHKRDLVLARNNKQEIGVKLLEGVKEFPQKDKDHAEKVHKQNLEMFNWTEEELDDGWIHLKHPQTGYLLEVSQCGQKLKYQGNKK